MSAENRLQTISVPAGSDLSTKQYLMMDVNSSGQLIIPTGAGAKTVGVLQDKPAAQGRPGCLAIGGKTKVVLGGTVAAGVEVVSDAAGKAVAVSATNTYVAGTLVKGGDANEIGEMIIKQYRHTVSA
jgi:hypothetical protein